MYFQDYLEKQNSLSVLERISSHCYGSLVHIVTVQSKGLRTKGVDGVRHHLRAEVRDPSSNSQAENEFFLSLPFCLIQALNELDGDYPHWGKQSTFLSLQIQKNKFHPETPSQTYSEIMFGQIPGYPMAWLS